MLRFDVNELPIPQISLASRKTHSTRWGAKAVYNCACVCVGICVDVRVLAMRSKRFFFLATKIAVDTEKNVVLSSLELLVRSHHIGGFHCWTRDYFEWHCLTVAVSEIRCTDMGWFCFAEWEVSLNCVCTLAAKRSVTESTCVLLLFVAVATGCCIVFIWFAYSTIKLYSE